MNVFPIIEISQTEQDIIAEKLSDPAVKKYFHSLGYQVAANLATGNPGPDESAEVFLRKRAVLQGHLELLETLLSINTAN